MEHTRRTKLFILLCLFFCSIASGANEPEVSYQNRPYMLPENEDYFSVTQLNLGLLDYHDHSIVRTPEQTYYEFNHLRHSKIDESQYLIWNFIPVGIGYSFPKDTREQLLAEWKLNYQPSESFLLSPNFTGKKKSFWSSLLGNEFVVSYGYHYQENPKPSFWDLSLKYTLFLVPIEKWHLGAFFQPKKFIKGLFSVPNSTNPFPFEKIYTSGLWTEFEFKNNLVLQLETAVNFFEKYTDTYLSKYSVASSLGFYF
jgi:hypothetical protein